jgi:hypothetical protein
MKNLICFIALLLIATDLEAQYSTMTQKQLEIALDQAKKRTNTGTGLVIVGSIALITGGVLYLSGLNQLLSFETDTDINAEFNKSMIGIGVGAAGTAMVAVGIPLWIVGKNKQDKVLIYLAKFDEQSYIPSVGFHLYF